MDGNSRDADMYSSHDWPEHQRLLRDDIAAFDQLPLPAFTGSNRPPASLAPPDSSGSAQAAFTSYALAATGHAHHTAGASSATNPHRRGDRRQSRAQPRSRRRAAREQSAASALSGLPPRRLPSPVPDDDPWFYDLSGDEPLSPIMDDHQGSSHRAPGARRFGHGRGGRAHGSWADMLTEAPRDEEVLLRKSNRRASESSEPNRIGSASTNNGQSRPTATEARDVSKLLLKDRDAVATIMYHRTTPDPQANDIWPNCRTSAKLPARYYLLSTDGSALPNHKAKRIPPHGQNNGKGKRVDGASEVEIEGHTGRSKWNLPVELVELIASSLNRDDIKSLRMVSRELNHHISQVIFKTVVVPFNTEIYGMLEQDRQPDFKGKKRARLDRPGYLWKNANGNEVYNGHGLDVFKGFGKHIMKFGMSFEVSEDSLAQPPAKAPTEKRTSFWGDYDWPYEDYRRFDAVAGLETAADETPRMKVAFSELERVKELALSIDNGLGWLNGPDRSIRARILQQPPPVFGTVKNMPDRHTQAQQKLWDYIEKRHKEAGRDVKQAILFRLDGIRPASDLVDASSLTEVESGMPYLDQHIINEATPASSQDQTDVQIPSNLDDPEILDRYVLTPTVSSSGILFTSTAVPGNVSQIMNPIIPTNLTKSQKEWLLETDWAQRAFVASYMLSIIDNPNTFTSIHTLTISRISDRYLSMLDRADFWKALPALCNLTLLVVPGWRTVHKDEAGFVETPKINPITNFDTYYDLLTNQIACRSNIQNLIIGWCGGGEHAEGLYARNKHIMPVPVLPISINGEEDVPSMTETNAGKLRAALLHFPYVERLTIKNSWITPAALLQFAESHGAYQLKSLVLDSISLTAVLRPPNPNQVQQIGLVQQPLHLLAGGLGIAGLWNMVNVNLGGNGGNQGQAGVQPNHNQVLQVVIQSILGYLQQLQGNAGTVQQQNQITALQQQLQQQFQQLQTQNQNQVQVPVPPPQPGVALHAQANINVIVQLTGVINQAQTLQQQMAAGPVNPNPAAPAAPPLPALAPPPAPAAPAAAPVPQTPATDPPMLDAQALLKRKPREGSWTNIIDMLSPGLNLRDFGSTHSKACPDRQTSLKSIEFISCGYAKLPHASVDQAAIAPAQDVYPDLTDRDPVLARRHASLGPAMLGAKYPHLGEIVQHIDVAELTVLEAGWNMRTGWDDADAARGVEFDGLLPGGTGRFTGVIRREDRFSDEASGAV